MTTNTTNSQAASIDTYEFRNLAANYGMAWELQKDVEQKHLAVLVAHIDAKLAQAREEGAQGKFDEGYAAGFNAVKERMVASEYRLAEIQRGVEGLKAYSRGYGYQGFEVDVIARHEVLALFKPQGQASDTSGLPG